MRIIRGQIDPDRQKLFKPMAQKFGFQDPDIIADLYLLLRYSGAGIPSREYCTRLAGFYAQKAQTSASSLELFLARRAAYYREIVKIPYFQGIATEYKGNELDGCDRFLLKLQELHLKKVMVQCAGCPLLNKCSFGQTYASHTKDIRMIRDANWQNMIHAECPFTVEFGLADAAAAARNMQEMAQEQQSQDNSEAAMPGEEAKELSDMSGEGEPSADTGSSDGSDEEDDPDQEAAIGKDFTGYSVGDGKLHQRAGAKRAIELSEKFISGVTSANIELWNLARHFDTAFSRAGKVFKETQQVSSKKENRKMRKLSDLRNVKKSQEMALPEEVRDAKEMKKDLTIRSHVKPEDKKQMFIALIDISGSMCAQVGTTKMPFTRISLANSFVLATARKMKTEGGYMVVRVFGSGVGPQIKAKTPDEFDRLTEEVQMITATGGGTNITAALEAAIDDIEKAKDELSGAEILLITDGYSSYFDETLQRRLQRVKLNVLDVSGSRDDSDYYDDDDKESSRYWLKKLAEVYMFVDSTKTKPADMVSLIGKNERTIKP